MFIEYNPNPVGRYDAGDCVIRAVAKVLDETWEDSFLRLCVSAYMMGTIPNADAVFGAVLRQNGFKKRLLPDTCPDCYTVWDFANEHPTGKYIVGLGGHVTAIVDGNIYDATDSSKGIPIYYWYKDDNEMEMRDGKSNATELLPNAAATAIPANAVSEPTANAADGNATAVKQCSSY